MENQQGNNIVLVGLMGAGKSTVGKELASILGYSFIDTDDELERRMGVSIPVIFDVEGEEGFRIRESKVIADMPSQKNSVISTGGGSVLNAENRHCLKQCGKVVYLSASVETLFERTKNSKKRPLLHNSDIKTTIESLLTHRQGLYLDVADIVIESGKFSPKDMAKRIVGKL